jgi:hypothetical protein
MRIAENEQISLDTVHKIIFFKPKFLFRPVQRVNLAVLFNGLGFRKKTA